MGYYPTPATLLDAITSYLAADPAGAPRLLDPCCGEGEALAHIATSLGATETWGAELSPQRAEIATRVLTKVHSCAWQSCRVGRGSVSLLLTNPPYDDDPLTHTRLEQQFLEDALPALCAGGVLIYIIPQRQLGNPAIARRLAGTLERITVVRFPAPEFDAFEQVVVFGVKRVRYIAPSQDSIDRIAQGATVQPDALPVLSMQGAHMYVVPPAPLHDLDGRAPCFRRMHWAPEDLLQAARTSGVRARSRAWRDAVNVVHADIVVHPAMPLKKGHIAMLMAAGLMGVMTLERKSESGDIERIVAKGRVIKTQTVHTEAVFDAHGRAAGTKTVSKDVFSTRVCTLDARGEQEVISDEAGLGQFMTAFGEQLAQQVIAKHQPAYDLQPTDAEWQTVSRLALDMRLPGRREGGLLPAQKHVAIAAARVMRKRRCAIISGEMGVGKTVMGCAAAELLNAYPAVVVCPPHLTKKWVKEIERATPGAVARIVNCVEKGNEKGFEKQFEKDHFPSHADASDSRGEDDVHVEKYSIMDFVRDWQAGKLGTKAFAIISRERAKLGSGWAPVAGVRRQYLRDEGAWAEFLCDPDTGAILLDDAGGQLLNDAASWRYLAARQRFSQTDAVKGWELNESETGTAKRTGMWGRRQVRTPLFTQGQGTGSLLNLPAMTGDDASQQSQQEDLSQRVGFRRYPLAAFIHRKLRGFFKLLIGDEAHQFKAARSDQAIAFHQISRACRWTLGLTGSLFGGKSTSLLHLAHRTSHEVRADFSVDDERRWAQQFGVLETTRWDGRDKADDETSEDGAWSGYGRERVQVRELPGISPGIVRYLLPHVVFARIADLGYELPPYEERVARLDMSPAQASQVHTDVYDPRANTGWLYKRMLDALKSGDNSLLSVWLQTALARPNSAFRADDVTRTLKRTAISNTNNNTPDITVASERRKLLRKGGERATLMQLAPTITSNEWLPKEKWLMDYCAGEALRGRKVLVYVRQTGTRDIQPRLAEALRSVGLRPKILRPSVPPERREAWVREHTKDIQVLITNPKLTETGLDMIMFSSVVYMELDYSLYTLWQSMRRVWRLGQTQPVTVTFLSYRDTLEDLALKLMGKKLYAAQLLYGDEVGGAIVESDDGNFLAELARAAISGAPVDDYAALFMRPMQSAPQDVPAESVLPAPTVRIVTSASGVTMSELRAFVGRSMRRTSQMPAVVPEQQISLFG
jgi:hypothetical protein